jgi:hypothetical protein
MASTRREILLSAAAIAVMPGAAAAVQGGGAITPERFGATGDGRTNDTDAFAAMAAFVNLLGGGEIALRPTTYLVGKQAPRVGGDERYAFPPASIMDFIGCRLPLTIRGNGAHLRCAAGMRYGTFGRASGRATRNRMPNYRYGDLAAPYRSMIRAEGCSGPIEISDLELDGKSGALQIGGQFGDVGWQIAGSGLELVNNSGPELISRVRSHHHPLDGIIIDGLDRRVAASRFEHVTCEYNGRQGCSIVGGRNYSFADSKFNHTGKAVIVSPPGAGVDIEAEGGKKIRALQFSRCEFSNNSGAGVVADSGDSEDARFEACTFIGTTSWAAWPRMPRFRFDDCTFVGPIVQAFGDSDPQRAAQFHNCTFRDDPALSPTEQVYGGENSDRPIADLPENRNVLFDRCRFLLTHAAVLPWTTNLTIFANCEMSQRAPATSYPRGTFIGRNVITGHVVLDGYRNRGQLIVNGKTLPLTG